MDQINKTAAKVRNLHDKRPENTSFGIAPVMAAKPFSKPSTPAGSVRHHGSDHNTVSDKSELFEETSLVITKNHHKPDHHSQTEDGSDTESIITKNKLKKIEQAEVALFELERCTTLIFISLSGERSEVLLTKRIVAYSELQREIAKLTPKTNKMYVIQNHLGKEWSALWNCDNVR